MKTKHKNNVQVRCSAKHSRPRIVHHNIIYNVLYKLEVSSSVSGYHKHHQSFKNMKNRTKSVKAYVTTYDTNLARTINSNSFCLSLK